MFTESNTTEQMILNATAKLGNKQASMARENALPYESKLFGDEPRPARWPYASHDQVSRQHACPSIEHGRFSREDRACPTTE
jgi:hypothetical protein